MSPLPPNADVRLDQDPPNPLDWRIAAACAGLALLVSAIGSGLLPTDELPAWHASQLDWKGGFTTQYRILSFWWPELLRRLGLPLIQAYAFGGAVVLFGSFLIFDRVYRRVYIRAIGPTSQPSVALPLATPSIEQRLLALTTLSLMWLLGLARVIQPVDPWSLLLVGLTVLAFLRRRRRLAWSAAALALAALNKETPFFLLPLLAFLEFRDYSWRRALLAIVLVPLPGTTVYWAIHHFFPVSSGFPLDQAVSNWRAVAGSLRHARLLQIGEADTRWLFVFLPWFFLIGLRWRTQHPVLKAMTLASLLPLGMDLAFGVPSEFRIFVDKFVLLIPPLFASIFPDPPLAPVSLRTGLALSGGALTTILTLSFAAHLIALSSWAL